MKWKRYFFIFSLFSKHLKRSPFCIELVKHLKIIKLVAISVIVLLFLHRNVRSWVSSSFFLTDPNLNAKVKNVGSAYFLILTFTWAHTQIHTLTLSQTLTCLLLSQRRDSSSSSKLFWFSLTHTCTTDSGTIRQNSFGNFQFWVVSVRDENS